MANDVAALIADAAVLGALPEAARQLLAVIDDADPRSERIAAAVRIDPVITARVLARTRACTVSAAAMGLGLGALQGLVRKTPMIRHFRGIPEHLVSMRSYWIHSVAVALIAHRLARIRGTTDPEIAYVAGLIHDLGALLIWLARPREARRILIDTENEGVPHREVEQRVLGIHHAELGGALLTSWGIADPLVVAVRWHHAPSAAPEHADQALVDQVHLADVIASALQLGNAGERAAHALDEAAFDRTGLAEAQLEGVLTEVEGQLSALKDAVLPRSGGIDAVTPWPSPSLLPISDRGSAS